MRHRQPRLTSAQRAEVVARYRAGGGVTTIAREYGLSREGIYKHLRAAGVVRPAGSAPKRQRQRRPAAYAYRDLLTEAEWHLAYWSAAGSEA